MREWKAGGNVGCGQWGKHLAGEVEVLSGRSHRASFKVVPVLDTDVAFYLLGMRTRQTNVYK